MSDKKIVILMLSWRDIKAPKKGGAEVHTHEMLKRLDKDKYRVIHFSPMFDGARDCEIIDGVEYHRSGNFITVIGAARKYYIENKNSIDFVIDQCNTHRFFTKFWVPQDKRVFYIHQLTREIWDINARFPFNKIGKWLETPMLRLNRKDNTITVSESTKRELVEIGFDPQRIYIIPNGVDESIYEFMDKDIEKEAEPTFIYVGRYSKYKGINVSIEALAIVKKYYPNAKLWICGKKDEQFVQEELRPLCKNLKLNLAEEADKGDVILLGFVEEAEKYQYMARAHALVFPSIREGWGIIVTEAGVLGTPSIVFNAPGTVDSVNYGKAGYMCKENTVGCVAENMLSVCLQDNEYQKMKKNSMKYSRKFKWENNGKLLDMALEKMTVERNKRRSV